MTANLQIFSLLFFMTTVAGLNPALAGYVMLAGKAWDAINDPMIGLLSDRTRSRKWGRRYPWMLWGVFPFGLSFFLLWVVPFKEQTPLFLFYVVVALVFNTAYTMVNLPYSALTAEMTSDYDERTSLNGFRFTFSIGGSIFSLIALGVASHLISDQRQLYFVIGLLFAILSVLPIFWCIWGTYGRTRQAALVSETHCDMPLRQQLHVAFSNRPFLLVIGIYLCSWLALQLTATVIPYYAVSWMGMKTADWPTVALAVQATAMLTLFVWGWVSARLGKRIVYFLGATLWIMAQAGLFFLQPGQTSFLYGLAILAGCGVSTAYLVPWSMLPDVVDLDELNTGHRREGLFYAFMVFLQKLGLALALAGLGQALDWAGFVKSQAGEAAPVQPEAALMVIRWAIGPLPTLLLAAGLVLAYLYPISRSVHASILLQLAERKASAST
ncbi:MAG: MFS transporter [Gloeomargaritaceae cyanobacterium C42_A2020_066]|nr:MFS transporter [Gloeomargaritaceae cyanobacterium C42_A2020_066]